MVQIIFKKMKLSEDKRTVFIDGDCYGKEVKIKLSILQLAKVFGTDRELAQDVEHSFGSEEYEDGCIETRKYVEKFPKISVWDREIEFSGCGGENREKKEVILIWGEDMGGWDNEGVQITFPQELYDRILEGKDYSISMTPFRIIFKY